MSLKVTVTDEQTGDTETHRIPEGGYAIACCEPCHVDGIQRWSKSGTVQLTIKGHHPKPLPKESET